MQQPRVALVLGSAACVYDDVEEALSLGEFAGIVGCNLIGRYWPGVMTAWCTLHPAHIKPWANRRREDGLPDHEQIYTHEGHPYRFPGQTLPGSSGLFALKVALDDLGFDRAVLCGIPMDPRPHFNDEKTWYASMEYQVAWGQAFPYIRERARSMNGWTADLLGRPTEDWISNG